MIITDEQYEQVCQGAVKDYPMEAVWLLTGSAGLVKVDNVADNPFEDFTVARAQILWALTQGGGLKGVIHSHPDGPLYPSHSDMASQIACGVPYGIVMASYDSAGGYIEFGVDSADRAPLFDRPFRHGVTDCYAFVRDYYGLEMGINLPDFARSWHWWTMGEDLYTKNLERTGFVRIDESDMRIGDMLLFSIRSDVPNHAAVYVGGEVMAHHTTAADPYAESRRPKRSPVNMYMKYLAGVYRHREADK